MRPLLVIFPYLKTSHPLILFDMKFWGSRDISEMPFPVQNDLRALLDMFFLRDNLKLTDMVFLYQECETEQDEEVYISNLLKAQALITFFYSSPHPTMLEPFATKEHIDFYIFSQKRFSKCLIVPDQYVEQIGPEEYPDTNGLGKEFEGYEGKLNNENHLWVTKGSRIYPTQPCLTLRYMQDLYRDFSPSGSKVVQLCDQITKSNIWELENLDDRLFTSLKWYNRSLSWNATEDIKLVNLAIALETLLGLKRDEAITKRFKESIYLLVGPVNNLDSWLEQFYKVRSAIVHDGTATETMFFQTYKKEKKDAKSQYRSLVSYGRIIFMICLNAIVAGAEMAHHMRLSQLFVTNKDRFEKICTVFSKTTNHSESLINDVLKIIDEILEYSFIGEEGLNLDLLLSTLKCLAVNLMNISVKIPEEIFDDLQKLVEIHSTKKPESCYIKLQAILNIENYKNQKGQTQLDERIEGFLNLNHAVFRYTMMIYFGLEKEFGDKS